MYFLDIQYKIIFIKCNFNFTNCIYVLEGVVKSDIHIQPET